ncbi:MAG: serine protease [Candidatus Omnitrophica bacterium]|jgi:S1-C subfamily serine protease|nr:serine protease [Candidatus Omnitrophota bacterium]
MKKLIACLFLTFVFCGIGFCGSVIQIIQDSMPAMVILESYNVQIVQGQDTYVKDGPMLAVVKPVGISQYTRKGGGVIVDPSGLIVANSHTTQQAGRVKVVLADNTEYQAEILVFSPDDDLAILRIKPDAPLKYITLADINKIKLGDPVYNVGRSDILKDSISEGKIIGIGTKTDPADKSVSTQMLKIDFNVYQGDSGGPVLNKDGELLGLILGGSVTSGRLALAVPSNKIKKYLDDALSR